MQFFDSTQILRPEDPLNGGKNKFTTLEPLREFVSFISKINTADFERGLEFLQMKYMQLLQKFQKHISTQQTSLCEQKTINHTSRAKSKQSE